MEIRITCAGEIVMGVSSKIHEMSGLHDGFVRDPLNDSISSRANEGAKNEFDIIGQRKSTINNMIIINKDNENDRSKLVSVVVACMNDGIDKAVEIEASDVRCVWIRQRSVDEGVHNGGKGGIVVGRGGDKDANHCNRIRLLQYELQRKWSISS